MKKKQQKNNWEKEIKKWCHMLARFSVIGFRSVKEGGEVKYFDNYIKNSLEVKNILRIIHQLLQAKKEKLIHDHEILVNTILDNKNKETKAEREKAIQEGYNRGRIKCLEQHKGSNLKRNRL